MPNITIRAELPNDVPGIRSVHLAAFPTAGEADLVDALRTAGRAAISLVAVARGGIVGHVLFSPITIDYSPAGLGLAPVAVTPDMQGTGIGSALIEAGLAACRDDACPLVVVLGEPDYYHRFGFTAASNFGLLNEYGVDDAFMAIPLNRAEERRGLVRYSPEFAAV